MLSFFRNFTKSRFGLIIVFLVLGVIAVAFGLSDVTGVRASGSSSSSTVLVRVGSQTVTEADVRAGIEEVSLMYRQNGRSFNMQEFIAQGGYERVLDQLTDMATAAEFARRNGMVVSQRLIDERITLSFENPDGSFNQEAFDQYLRERRKSLQRVRSEVSMRIDQNWLGAIFANTGVPDRIVLPYAAIEAQRRRGTMGLVPTAGMDSPPPDEKTLKAFYTANLRRYMVPERRTIRYALIRMEDVRAVSAATEEEIAQAYKDSGTRFAASEKRSVRQLILADQAAADKVVAAIKAGKSLVDQAKTLQLDAGNFADLDQAGLAKQTSSTIADAAFKAPRGGVVGPVKSPLGWAVLEVEEVDKIAAKTLDQARPDLAGEIATRKTAEALALRLQAVEDSIGRGRTFDELVGENKLGFASVGPVTGAGINPDDPASKADPSLAEIVKAGFELEPGTEPHTVAVGKEGSFAVVAVPSEGVIKAAPRPFEQIRERVLNDYRVDEALKKAKTASNEVIKQLERGVPMAQALAAAGVKSPQPPQDFDKLFTELGDKPPISLQLAFTLGVKKAGTIEAPNRSGYIIVYLNSIVEGDPSKNPATVEKTRGALTQMMGGELFAQFRARVGNELQTVRNEAAIARLKADLAASGVR